MCPRLGLAAFTSLVLMGVAQGQQPLGAGPVAPAPVAVALPPPCAGCAACGQSSAPDCAACGQPGACDCAPVYGPPGRFWVDADYLLWWVRGANLPPLVTTSPPGTSEARAGVPGSAVLFGDSIVNGAARSGGRLDTGYWFDDEHIFGFEANFFLLSATAKDFSASSTGNPILARPFLDVSGAADSELVAFPGVIKGSVQATATAGTMFGNDLLLRENLATGCWYRFDFIGGYRYLHYNDGLSVTENLTSVSSTLPVAPGTNIVVNDVFHASNDFYGFEWGFTGEARWGRLIVDGLAKVAVGYDNEEIVIEGTTTSTPPGGPSATNAGGLLALPSNIGSHHNGNWTALPEFGLRVGYQVSPHVRAFAGYTLIYWPEAVRAADQVSLSVNTSQIPGVAASGGAFPAFFVRNADIWAQGIDLGIEFHF
jgi:Putative beta barrel porin-7 (BBP7)